MEDAIHDVAFHTLYRARSGAFLDQMTDFIFRYLGNLAPCKAVDFQYGIGRPGQEGDGRRKNFREPAHRPGNGGRYRFRIGQRDTLRHEFAEDERQIGDDDDDDGESNRLGIGADKRPAGYSLTHRLRQRGTAKGTGKDANQCDADLNNGKEAARLPVQMRGGFRTGDRGTALLAAYDKRLQTLTAGGNDGHFRHRKEPVQQDQNEQNNDVRKHDVPGGWAASIGGTARICDGEAFQRQKAMSGCWAFPGARRRHMSNMDMESVSVRPVPDEDRGALVIL